MHIGARQAVRRLGGRKKLARFAETVSKAHGVKVDIAPHVNEENPADSWLNVLIETPNELFNLAARSDARDAAIDDVERFLAGRGMWIAWECGGDGETGPISSYRVLAEHQLETKGRTP